MFLVSHEDQSVRRLLTSGCCPRPPRNPRNLETFLASFALFTSLFLDLSIFLFSLFFFSSLLEVSRDGLPVSASPAQPEVV